MGRRQFLRCAGGLAAAFVLPPVTAGDAPDAARQLGALWQVPHSARIELWPSALKTDVASVLAAIADWQIPASSRVVIRIEDGQHRLTSALRMENLAGDRILVIGNTRAPERCQLLWSSDKDMVYAPPDRQFGLIDGMVLMHDGSGRGAASAFLADGGGVICCGSNVAVRGFYYGFQARFGGIIRCAETRCSGAGDAGYFAFQGGHIDAPGARSEGARDDANSLGSGFVAEYGGTINAVGAIALYNALAGFTALSNGSIRAYDSVAGHNGRAGYYTDTGGVIVAHRGKATLNCGEGHLDGANRGFEGQRVIIKDNHAKPASCRRP